MKLEFAVERLYQVGWSAGYDSDLEQLPDGRPFPSVGTVTREFAHAGLQLTIQHNLQFKCYRATWTPAGQSLDPSHAADEHHGTVIGACEREAAVYALAHLRAAQAEKVSGHAEHRLAPV